MDGARCLDNKVKYQATVVVEVPDLIIPVPMVYISSFSQCLR